MTKWFKHQDAAKLNLAVPQWYCRFYNPNHLWIALTSTRTLTLHFQT
jgi:hypothetical protein